MMQQLRRNVLNPRKICAEPVHNMTRNSAWLTNLTAYSSWTVQIGCKGGSVMEFYLFYSGYPQTNTVSHCTPTFARRKSFLHGQEEGERDSIWLFGNGLLRLAPPAPFNQPKNLVLSAQTLQGDNPPIILAIMMLFVNH